MDQEFTRPVSALYVQMAAALTWALNPFSVVKMHLVKSIFLVALVVALAAYSFDCGAAMTPEQAMKCCDSMPCSSQGQHGQDCCNTMPSAQASFVQPTCAARVSFVPVVFAVLQASIESCGVNFSERVIAEHLDAAPISPSPGLVPLRI
jgi:hypothetical protein